MKAAVANGSQLALLFLINMYVIKSPLIGMEKCREELLYFFMAYGYKRRGTSMANGTIDAFYKLTKDWSEKLHRVSSNHFGIDFY